MAIENFLICVLCTFGITDLITRQNGLFHIFKRWRNYLARNKPQIDDDNDNLEDWELYNNLYDAFEHSFEGHLYELFSCYFCLGFWVSGLIVFLLTGIGWYSLIYWLAVYGGHAIIAKVIYK